MGLLGKLKAGLSSASKHLKTRHFKMTAAELAEKWKELSSAKGIYISFKERGNQYELESVSRVIDHGRELIEIWYLEEVYEDEEEEASNPRFESERRRLEPDKEVWIHMSEAQYEKLMEKFGDFLREFEA